MVSAKFSHVNLVAHDWKRLARFYEQVFGCVPVPPERDLSGQWIDDAVNVPDVHIRGMHLRLPGYGDAGPTLEIFQYDPDLPHAAPAANRPGFGHIAFAVDDVEAAREAVLTAGGADLGQGRPPRDSGRGEHRLRLYDGPGGEYPRVAAVGAYG